MDAYHVLNNFFASSTLRNELANYRKRCMLKIRVERTAFRPKRALDLVVNQLCVVVSPTLGVALCNLLDALIYHFRRAIPDFVAVVSEGLEH